MVFGNSKIEVQNWEKRGPILGHGVTLPGATRNFYVDGHVPKPHYSVSC